MRPFVVLPLHSPIEMYLSFLNKKNLPIVYTQINSFPDRRSLVYHTFNNSSTNSVTESNRNKIGQKRKPIVYTMGFSGERGIRTPGTLTSTPVFKTGSFDHSDISPRLSSY